MDAEHAAASGPVNLHVPEPELALDAVVTLAEVERVVAGRPTDLELVAAEPELRADADLEVREADRVDLCADVQALGDDVAVGTGDGDLRFIPLGVPPGLRFAEAIRGPQLKRRHGGRAAERVRVRCDGAGLEGRVARLEDAGAGDVCDRLGSGLVGVGGFLVVTAVWRAEGERAGQKADECRVKHGGTSEVRVTSAWKCRG